MARMSRRRSGSEAQRPVGLGRVSNRLLDRDGPLARLAERHSQQRRRHHRRRKHDNHGRGEYVLADEVVREAIRGNDQADFAARDHPDAYPKRLPPRESAETSRDAAADDLAEYGDDNERRAQGGMRGEDAGIGPQADADEEHGYQDGVRERMDPLVDPLLETAAGEEDAGDVRAGNRRNAADEFGGPREEQ